MSFIAFVLILSSAALHVSWNLMAKKNGMSVPFYTLICSTSTLIWFHVLLWTPIPFGTMPAAFWCYLGGSIASDLFYCCGLMMAYRALDMSAAYPVMRALPILLTVAVTTLLKWGSPLSPTAKLGMLIVFAGCLMMPLARFSDFKLSSYLNARMLFVVATACGTTGYTICDSQAQRLMADSLGEFSKLMRTLTFYSMRGILLSSSLWLAVLLVPSNRAQMRALLVTRNWRPYLAGVFASATYVLVLLSMNHVTNVSYVQVFRQLGLPIGMLAEVFVLKERGTWTKCIGIVLILLGLLLTVVH